MAEPTWNHIETLVLTGTIVDLRSATLPAGPAVLLVDCTEPYGALLTLLPRTTAAIVLLADVDAIGTAQLVSAGADDVLARSATFAEVMRAARHAVARRLRATSDHGASTTSGGTTTVTGTPPAAVVPLANPRTPPARVSPSRPTSPDVSELPPQLQAVGRLAGGVAHDFNNLLQVIGGGAERLVHELEEDESCRTTAQTIVDAARRAATLTHQLLAFGRRQTLIATSVDVPAAVQESVPHLRARLGPGVHVDVTSASEVLPVHVDRSQLLEVLSNLADAAAWAMPEGGTLSIATSMVTADAKLRRHRPWLKPGEYVQILVTDTGAGIDAASLPHVFEPFFMGRGSGSSGLGLSAVYGVVKQSGGYIWVESGSSGTSVTILLPPAGQARGTSSVRTLEPRGRVLLVEDDDGVRDLLAGVLTHYGYAVEAFPNAEQALEHERMFDLLLSDVLLPGMNGPELAKAIRGSGRRVPVLLMSGDTGHVVDPKELDAGGFLQKPFSARTLVARVEALIEASRAERSPNGP